MSELGGTPPTQDTVNSDNRENDMQGGVQILTATPPADEATTQGTVPLVPVLNQEELLQIQEEREEEEQFEERYPILRCILNTALFKQTTGGYRLECDICIREVGKYTQEYIYDERKFFFNSKDLDDITTRGSAGYIILRAFRLLKNSALLQRRWWDAVKYSIVLAKIRHLRGLAAVDVKKCALNRKVNLLLVASFFFVFFFSLFEPH